MAARKGSSRKSGSSKRQYSKEEKEKLRKVFGGGLSAPAAVILLLFLVIFCYGAYLEKGAKEEPAAVVNSFIEKDADLQIRYIDVGQGDCELISYRGKNVLIDAGEDEAAKDLLAFLDGLSITRLDYVIATHPHSDHIGAMDKVIEKYDIGTVIAPRIREDMVPTTKVYERFLKALSDKGLKLTAAKVGEVYTLADEYRENDNTAFEIIAPVGNDYDDLNDWSVVIRLVHGKNAFLFTGDAEKPSERDIIGNGEDIFSNVLKAGHHGSSSSTSEGFLEAVSPEAVIISCGEGNTYGHPHKETIDRLSKNGIAYYQTRISGTITVYSDGEKIRIKTEKENSENDDS